MPVIVDFKKSTIISIFDESIFMLVYDVYNILFIVQRIKCHLIQNTMPFGALVLHNHERKMRSPAVTLLSIYYVIT